jgi:CO/xanthine dehydrogenase Mo-binding subunit
MEKKIYVGEGISRIDALGKVRGETKYASDLKVPGMCYGKILYSAHPRALICKIDIESARTLDGVKRVITAPDIAGANLFGYDIHHRPVLVGEGQETRFVGDAVALVVGETLEIAADAIKKIKVEYDVLPPLAFAKDSISAGEYRIHTGTGKSAYQSNPEAKGNICYQTRLIHGDVARAFEKSEVVVEDTYSTSRQEHAFLETEAGIAFLDGQGILHILSAIQDPYVLLEDVSSALGIPKSRIHIKGITAGGAFGGKLHNTIQVHLAAMAYISGVPVKLVLDRYESFIAHPKRHSQEIWIKIGSSRDGRIEAIEADIIADAGPYSSRTPEVLGLTVSAIVGPYSIPNAKVVGRAAYTNNVDADAFRGFGAPQAALAREGILDKLARALGLNPLVLREKNFLKPGEKTIAPLRGDSPVSLDVLSNRIAEKMGPWPVSKGGNLRVGRAVCFDMPVFDVSAIPVLGKSGVGTAIELFSDASATVYAGGCELGQGVTTLLAQIVAEELGIAIENVRVEMTDTWTCPPAGRTSASRLTYVLGNSLILATGKIRDTLLERAAKMLEINKDDLILAHGRIAVKGTPSRNLGVSEVAKACSNEGINLRQEGWFKYPESRLMYGHTFMASAADVSVDVDTGEIRVLKLVNVHDSGKVINPVMAKGQQLGGSVQALGLVLTEDFVVADGRVKTSSLAEYAIPTSLDIPDEFLGESIETPYPTGPYGAKGMAEHSLNTTAPAVLNAICNAIRCDITRIPVYVEDVLSAIRQKPIL